MGSKENPVPVPKMNSTNLYVTTTQIIMKSDPTNPNSWQDLYRLVPYLRNSLCCVVCSYLLVDPLTPMIAQCQHHLCRPCKGGRKKIKPACEGCKDCKDYMENKRITVQASQPGTGFERGASNLILLIKEGASFEDDYKSKGGLPKSAYSILPCIYTNSANTHNTQLPPTKDKNIILNSNMQNRSSFYSVLYPGTGSKITLKRKQKESTVNSPKVAPNRPKEFPEKPLFKKPCTMKPKKGCRCGNATATPGKLTCCGQRCPCYVDSKPCIECKCRGCRNPHRMDGQKVMPHIPELQQIRLVPTTQQPILGPDIQSVKIEELDLNGQFTAFDSLNLNQHFKTYKLVSGNYNGMPLEADLLPIEFNDEDDDSEITVV